MARLSVTVTPVASPDQAPKITEEVVSLYPERNIFLQDKAPLPSFVKKALTKLRWTLFATEIETDIPCPEGYNVRRDVDEIEDEEGLEAPKKKTTKATISKSTTTSSYTQARKTVPPPTKVKKEAHVATESKQGKKKSPVKVLPRKGVCSSQRLKRSSSSTKRPEGASSEKPITLSDKEEDSEDNEPIAKRLKTEVTSKPTSTAKETSPSSSATSDSSDVSSPPPSPAHSSLPPRTQQPSPRQQQGEGIKETDTAPAAEEQVAEQEAQPKKKLDKGKEILVESPKKKKPTVPRQICLGGPLSCPIIRPDTSGDEAIARALAEDEGLEVSLLMEEQNTTAPSSSKIKKVAIRQTPEESPAFGSNNNQKKKKKPASLIPAIPIASRRKSQIGIAEIFEMMGKKMEKLLPKAPSVPQLDMAITTEELKALRNRLDQLSSSFIKFQEQHKEDMEQLLNTVQASIKNISAAPSAPTLPAVRNEIRNAADSLKFAHSMHNTRAEKQLRRLYLQNTEVRTETTEALKAFGTYLEGRIT
ncbi:uncharacterized protein LOC133307198 [Gastrolobium bilobum]|uniref:uncharacterized protein LOC133307198 n=1 Tax=Gastrolobium bilobum TaxID=150636 RepID=UPI002AB2DD2D|nr:uncharacterized protein LOC133307198 [Gastrolobium bilobum]